MYTVLSGSRVLFTTLALALVGCEVSHRSTVVQLPPTEAADKDSFNELFTEAYCEAAYTCGDRSTIEALACGAVDAGEPEQPCVGFDVQAAELCLAGEFTCDSVAGITYTMPPPACRLVCEPTPPTPQEPATPPTPSFEWTVTFADGDEDPYRTHPVDTITVQIANSLANHPDVVEWEFGYAQTEVPGGWMGEDCDGITDSYGYDLCHLMDPDTTMVLEHTDSFGGLVEGSTTLLSVEYPASSAPGITSVVYGYDALDVITACYVQGHQPGYYGGSGCDVYVP